MKNITISSNLTPLYISLRYGVGGSTHYSLKAYNKIKLENKNYKHTSLIGGII